jgi:hypothetical protein
VRPLGFLGGSTDFMAGSIVVFLSAGIARQASPTVCGREREDDELLAQPSGGRQLAPRVQID